MSTCSDSYFNSSKDTALLITNLIKKLNIKTFVETGTYFGLTTMYLAKTFPDLKIITVEVNEQLYNNNKSKFNFYKNIDSRLGSSVNIIPQLDINKNELTCYYLDAHWKDHDPLLKELDIIFNSSSGNELIIIDDFHVPGIANLFNNSPIEDYESHHTYDGIKQYLNKEWYYFYNSNMAQIILFNNKIKSEINVFIENINNIPYSKKIFPCILCNNISSNCCQNCNTYYCSRECQKKDWIKHKNTCKNPCKKEKSIYIIDVGSSWNGYTTKNYKALHNKQYPILFIEPDKEAFNRLPISVNDIKIPIAINISDGEVEFNFYQEGTHSILKTNLNEIHKYIDGYSNKPARIQDWAPKKTEIIKCLRLDTLLKQYNIDKVDFLKIDTQGFDFNVIKSLGERIRDVRLLECEVQITDFEVYLNSSKKNDIIKYMNSFNFILIKTEKQTADQEENLYFENKSYSII